MQNLILNKAQAEMIRDAMCSLNNIGGKIAVFLERENGDLIVQETLIGIIVVRVNGAKATYTLEEYESQYKFFIAYGVE